MLIFLGRKKKTVSKEHFKAQDVDELISELKTEPYISDSFELEENDTTSNSDQAFASLGFGAFDSLLTDKPQVEPSLQPQQSINPTPRITSLNGQMFIIFYLIAPNDRPFVGYELLQSLLAAGLRYGEMNIFHYCDAETTKPLFSIASATEPGTFDLANIGAVSCPGLSLFLSVANTGNLSAAYELMVDTAMQLADDLEGTLYDEDRQLLTEDVIDRYRDLINSDSQDELNGKNL